MYLDFLNNLKNNKNKLSIRKICRDLVAEHTASVYMNDMVSKGLITKYKSGSRYVISMTEQGHKLLEIYNLLTTREVK
jgi:predicted transcriptional regulator